jgi:hypothetical protein
MNRSENAERKAPRNQEKDKQPAPINVDCNPRYFADTKTMAHICVLL